MEEKGRVLWSLKQKSVCVTESMTKGEVCPQKKCLYVTKGG